MNKKILTIGIFILLIALFSGCTEQDQQSTTILEPTYVIMDSYESRDENSELQYVYVEIQNIDEKPAFFEVVFTFGVIDESNLGEGYDWGGKTGDWYPGMDPYDYSYEVEKRTYIQSHETERIYCYTIPQSGTNIAIGWDYEIST